MSAARGTCRDFFFSPMGRFGRAQFWGATFAICAVLAAYFLPVAILEARPFAGHEGAQTVYFLIGSALGVAAIVAQLFATLKRFQDRAKAWPWLLVVFIPYIGPLWILVECGCLPGTKGPNRFGDDPRADAFAKEKEVADAPARMGRVRSF